MAVRRTTIGAACVVSTAVFAGCWSHIDALPWMDIPPYRDPPPGFSSTYHRALYGPRPPKPAPAPTDVTNRPRPQKSEDRLELLRHSTPAENRDAATREDGLEPAPPSRRLPSFDFLMRPAKPIRF